MQVQNLPVTEWRECTENRNYAVDSSGVVYRICREQRSKSGKIIRKYEIVKLRGSLDRYGYRTYRMMVNGKKKHIKGHRLVANAFLGYEKKSQVNHLDGNKTNNAVVNLEWVTPLENVTHAIKSGLLDPKKGGRAYRKIHLSEYISIYIMIKHCNFSRREIANINKVSTSTIDNVYNKMDRLMGNIYATA